MSSSLVLLAGYPCAAPVPAAKRVAGEEVTIQISKNCTLVLCWIPEGEATLGSPVDEEERNASVELEREFKSTSFLMGKYEVTQQQWVALMGSNPSYYIPTCDEMRAAKIKDTSQYPVENVSWYDICGNPDKPQFPYFLKKLNAISDKKPLGFEGTFRLPLSDEWEYAYRGGKGNKSPYYWGKSLNGIQANCHGSIPYGTETRGPDLTRTTSIGSYQKQAPHPWGLCDMSGNVLELCHDSCMTTEGGPFMRGGSTCQGADACRASSLLYTVPTIRDQYTGFRVVFAPGK